MGAHGRAHRERHVSGAREHGPRAGREVERRVDAPPVGLDPLDRVAARLHVHPTEVADRSPPCIHPRRHAVGAHELEIGLEREPLFRDRDDGIRHLRLLGDLRVLVLDERAIRAKAPDDPLRRESDAAGPRERDELAPGDGRREASVRRRRRLAPEREHVDRDRHEGPTLELGERGGDLRLEPRRPAHEDPPAADRLDGDTLGVERVGVERLQALDHVVDRAVGKRALLLLLAEERVPLVVDLVGTRRERPLLDAEGGRPADPGGHVEEPVLEAPRNGRRSLRGGELRGRVGSLFRGNGHSRPGDRRRGRTRLRPKGTRGPRSPATGTCAWTTLRSEKPPPLLQTYVSPPRPANHAPANRNRSVGHFCSG